MGKKQQKKETAKPVGKKSSSFSLGTVFFLLFAVIGGLSSYYVYASLTAVPDLPKLDLDAWWGPLPRNPKQDTSVRPYSIEFSDVMINDLKERLLHRRPFVPPLENIGFQYGFNTNFLTRVLDYWQNSYNFKQREAFFNSFQHYKTNIQGLDIHFMHVKPKVSDGVEVVPLLLLHGWPGSIREFYELVPKLTTPRPGYKFVFEVIAPSLPGYGFSDAAVRPGLGAAEVAVVMHNLMSRIGHARYALQGGDWGHIIGASLVTLFPGDVVGFHTNIPLVSHRLGSLWAVVGSWFPSLVVEPELQSRMYPYSEFLSRMLEETGYMHLQATKPDTIGAALTDSPAGLAAYILEKFSTWTNPAFKRAADGELLGKYALTHLLDNVMVYWTTNSITTSMRLYAETFNKRQMAYLMDEIPTEVPTWGIKFKHELAYQPDCILRLKYKNYLHSTVVEDGGHFAAFQMPDVMADDMFEAQKTFAEFNALKAKTVVEETAKTIYEFTVKDINGNPVKLNRYKGHVTIIVNVASQCGLTERNYKELNELYEKYATTKGLRILAFPCNQFNGQEPGSPEEILAFTKQKQVKFDLFEKVEVNGDGAHPLWKFLKRSQGGTVGDFIKWNFSKFIIDRNGVPVERLGPNVNPLDIEPYLAKYW